MFLVVLYLLHMQSFSTHACKRHARFKLYNESSTAAVQPLRSSLIYTCSRRTGTPGSSLEPSACWNLKRHLNFNCSSVRAEVTTGVFEVSRISVISYLCKTHFVTQCGTNWNFVNHRKQKMWPKKCGSRLRKTISLGLTLTIFRVTIGPKLKLIKLYLLYPLVSTETDILKNLAVKFTRGFYKIHTGVHKSCIVDFTDVVTIGTYKTTLLHNAKLCGLIFFCTILWEYRDKTKICVYSNV